MAWTVSGLYVTNWIDVLDTTQLVFNLNLDTYKIAFQSNAATPNFSTDVTWTNANEVSGTGWPSGGVTLATAASGGGSTNPTVTESPTGTIMYDMADILVTPTTLTGVRAARIYAAPLGGLNLIVGINFGADYNTTTGPINIVWAAGGVFNWDVTP
jgi:hypothetical protein